MVDKGGGCGIMDLGGDEGDFVVTVAEGGIRELKGRGFVSFLPVNVKCMCT